MKKIGLSVFGLLVLFFWFSHAETGVSISWDYNQAKQTILNTVPDTIKQWVSEEFSIFEKLENKDQKKESLQKIIFVSIENINNTEEVMNTVIMPNLCTIMKVHEIESESCKTQNYLNNENNDNDMKIIFILIGIIVITGIIWFVLSKVNEKIMNYIIFGWAILFLGFVFIAVSDYPGFWQSAGTIIWGFAGIFVGLVIFFLYKRKQEIKNIEKQRNIEQNIIINTNKKNEEIAGLVNEIIIKQNKKDFYWALEECDKCIEIIKDHKEYEDRYNQLVWIKSHIQEEIKLKEDIQKKIQNTSKNSKEEFIELINELYAIEEYGKAIEICQIAIKKNPQEAIFYWWLGDIFLKNNEKDNALDAYENCIKLDNKNKEVRINKAIILEKMEKYEEALKVADEVLLLDKNYTKAYYVKALILDKLWRDKEIMDLFYNGIKNSVWWEEFYLVITSKLINEKDYEEGIKICNEAIKISPMDEKIYTNKTACLLALKRYQEAEECANYILDKINPNCVSILINKACILKEINRDNEALDILNKAIKLDPKHANSYFNKASILLKQKNIPETLSLLQKTFELDPNFKKIILTEDEFKDILDVDEFKKLI